MYQGKVFYIMKTNTITVLENEFVRPYYYVLGN